MKHLLIDFENTQPADLNKISDDDCQIWLFLGLHQQKSIPIDLCESLLRFGKNVHFVRLEKTGKNALDFYLAFYMGRITQTDPDAQICILSKDGGFDPLVEHIDNRKMAEQIVRVKELSGKSVKMLGNGKNNAAQTAPQPLPQTDNALIRNGFKKAVAYFSQAEPPLPGNYEKLLKTLRKLLKSELKTHRKNERLQSVEKIAAKLLLQGFISADAGHNLHYHFSSKDFDQRLIKRILALRPRSRTALYNVIQSFAGSGQDTDTGNSEQTAAKLAQQRIFIFNNNKISYPDEIAEADIIDAEIMPSETVLPPTQAAPANRRPKASATLSDAAQKTLAVLQKISRNRPISSRSLQNSIASWLRTEAGEAAVVFDELQAHGIIHLDGNRIRYTF
ncbi:PIN domain-containing protein [Uruburuella testudinis]|uniref:PIN domain-containing protein n=1 Tax=Uruburuella testudinis TaxID=1282863 RepID=A0ABY4DZA3_9NEIS|nr:PIN domain-containing protein [Uruburuella testudinis]UOO82917.1 PIN domain-containing protein [Uruburuella testudinis]